MSGKTFKFWLSNFLLSIAVISSCSGADQAAVFDLKQTLNERFNERILSDLTKNRNPIPHLLVCGGAPWFGCGSYSMDVKIPCLQLPQCSKNSLPDAPVSILTAAFRRCTEFRILILDLSGTLTGNFARLPQGSMYENHFVENRVITEDVFAMRLVFRWLTENLEVNETAFLYEESTANAEMEEFRKSSRFAPNIVFEFYGIDSLRVELDTENRYLLLRTKDKWGSYDFDQLSAIEIEARVKDLAMLYAETPTNN
jgi:hypothetical protein